MIRSGQRVRIAAEWSLFRNRRGTITTSHGDYAHVLIDGDEQPIRFGVDALEVLVGEIDCPAGSGAE